MSAGRATPRPKLTEIEWHTVQNADFYGSKMPSAVDRANYAAMVAIIERLCGQRIDEMPYPKSKRAKGQS